VIDEAKVAAIREKTSGWPLTTSQSDELGSGFGWSPIRVCIKIGKNTGKMHSIMPKSSLFI
jgi:hypothetical protein